MGAEISHLIYLGAVDVHLVDKEHQKNYCTCDYQNSIDLCSSRACLPPYSLLILLTITKGSVFVFSLADVLSLKTLLPGVLAAQMPLFHTHVRHLQVITCNTATNIMEESQWKLEWIEGERWVGPPFLGARVSLIFDQSISDEMRPRLWHDLQISFSQGITGKVLTYVDR